MPRRSATIDAAVAAARSARAVILDLEENDSLDITSSVALAKLHGGLTHAGVQLALSDVHTHALEMLHKTGLLETMGEDHIFANLELAVASARAR